MSNPASEVSSHIKISDVKLVVPRQDRLRNCISDEFLVRVCFCSLGHIESFSISAHQHPIAVGGKAGMFPHIESANWLPRKKSNRITRASWCRKALSVPKGLATPKTDQFAFVLRTNQRRDVLEIGLIDGVPGYFGFPTCVSQHPHVHGGFIMDSRWLRHRDRINQVIYIPF